MAPTIKLTILLAVCACATAQYDDERSARYIASETKAPPAPPVAILKQINRHNEDGSYTYGYESGDGSFKIETKSPTGEVKGKYGYKDDTGKLRVIEYGANKYGFQPAGEGITVAPPTLVDETTRDQEGARPGKGQSGRTQYRAQPVQQAVDYDYEEPQQQQQQQYRPAPAPPAPRPAAPPRHQQQQQYRPAPQAAPVPPRPSFFAGAAPVPAEQELFAPAPQPAQKYRPAPAPAPAVQYTQNFGPAPSQNNFAPDARFSQAPQQYQQPRSQQAPFSMLDQLLKEYALPQGGSAPLHDITFGTY